MESSSSFQRKYQTDGKPSAFHSVMKCSSIGILFLSLFIIGGYACTCRLFPVRCPCDPGTDAVAADCSECSPSCANDGICIGEDECECLPATKDYASDCSDCSSPCNNNGLCQPDDTCVCTESSTVAADCNSCSGLKECLNGGTCTGADTCTCADGFAGETCESCIPPCAHSGVCQMDGSCECLPVTEDYAMDCSDCSAPCSNSGDCQPGDTCACTESSTIAADCSDCALGCQNGGTCVGTNTCSCAGGYYGASCQNEPAIVPEP